MELRLSPVTSPLTLRPAQANRAAAPSAGATGATGETSFAGALSGALKNVSSTQISAEAMQKEVQLQNPNVSLEDTMVAMQKSQIGFTATMHVRNRMVQAYTDIMNMSV